MLTLQSSLAEIRHLKPFLKEMQQWSGFSDDLFFGIRLALNEAVTNAIEHGNQQNPSKKVYIKVVKGESNLIVSVRDEGLGFEAASIPDPREEKNLFKESGRGIFLIRQYADEISFDRKGSKIIMKFKFKNI